MRRRGGLDDWKDGVSKTGRRDEGGRGRTRRSSEMRTVNKGGTPRLNRFNEYFSNPVARLGDGTTETVPEKRKKRGGCDG